MHEGRLCVLFAAHTTAALTTGEIGEGTDDLLEVVEQVIPRIRFLRPPYRSGWSSPPRYSPAGDPGM